MIRKNDGVDAPVQDPLPAPDTITYLTSPTGRIVAWSSEAARFFRRNIDEALGAHCCDLTSGRDLNGNVFCSEHCPVMTMASKGESPRPFPIVFRRGKGPERAYLMNITLLTEGRKGAKILHELTGLTPAPAPATAPPAAAGVTVEQAPAEISPLTPRELQILRVMVDGTTAESTARRLGISVATVRAHLRSIYTRLGVRSRAAAVAAAIRHGWL